MRSYYSLLCLRIKGKYLLHLVSKPLLIWQPAPLQPPAILTFAPEALAVQHFLLTLAFPCVILSVPNTFCIVDLTFKPGLKPFEKTLV